MSATASGVNWGALPSISNGPSTTVSSGPAGVGGNQLSPSVLVIVIVLAIVVLVSVCLHVLVKHLSRSERRNRSDVSREIARAAQQAQGRLQQLFSIPDSGLQESIIDSLPTFTFKSLNLEEEEEKISLHPGFDCAICLCEFHIEDILRLLPGCSHAFHVNCIDKWLYSHSTCPLCRSKVLPNHHQEDCPFHICTEDHHNPPSTITEDSVSIFVSSSNSENSNINFSSDPVETEPPLPIPSQTHGSIADTSHASSNIDDAALSCHQQAGRQSLLLPVKLGKFRNKRGQAEYCSNEIDRRCFSMGSFEYVVEGSREVKVLESSRKRTNEVVIDDESKMRVLSENQNERLIRENNSDRWSASGLCDLEKGDKDQVPEAGLLTTVERSRRALSLSFRWGIMDNNVNKSTRQVSNNFLSDSSEARCFSVESRETAPHDRGSSSIGT